MTLIQALPLKTQFYISHVSVLATAMVNRGGIAALTEDGAMDALHDGAIRLSDMIMTEIAASEKASPNPKQQTAADGISNFLANMHSMRDEIVAKRPRPSKRTRPSGQ